MAKYLILNVIFTMMVVLVLRIRPSVPGRAWLFTLAVVLLLTALFDSFIVGAGIVAYDRASVLGIFVGKAPIEDFAYTIVAVMIVTKLWNKMGAKS